MLTLKDLSADKALDRKALTEIRGGTVFNTVYQGTASSGVGGLVGISDVDQHAYNTNFDSYSYSSLSNALNVLSPGGFAFAV